VLFTSFDVELSVIYTTVLSVDGSTSEAPGSDSTVDDSDTIASIGGARRGGGNVGAIAGGVVGAPLAVLILVMIAVVIVWKHYNNRREANKGMIKGCCILPVCMYMFSYL
jgi:hypothetical protein